MESMNPMTPPGAPMNQPMTPIPKKSHHGTFIGIVVLILLIVAVIVFWPKNTVSNTNSTAQNSTTSQSTQAQSDDLNSLQADIDATNVDGVSGSL